VWRSIDNQFHSPRQNMDDLFLADADAPAFLLPGSSVATI